MTSRARVEAERLEAAKSHFPDISINNDIWPLDFPPGQKHWSRYVILRNVRLANNEPEPIDLTVRAVINPLVESDSEVVLDPEATPLEAWDQKTSRQFLPEVIHLGARGDRDSTITGYLAYRFDPLFQKLIGVRHGKDAPPEVFQCILEIEDVHSLARERFRTPGIVFGGNGESVEAVTVTDGNVELAMPPDGDPEPSEAADEGAAEAPDMDKIRTLLKRVRDSIEAYPEDKIGGPTGFMATAHYQALESLWSDATKQSLLTEDGFLGLPWVHRAKGMLLNDLDRIVREHGLADDSS